MDLTTRDPDGEPWNFSLPGQRQKALQRIRETEPTLVVGSPMCAMFSQLQALNALKCDPIKFRKAKQEAIEHLKFALEVYKIQMEGGRYFLHAQPSGTWIHYMRPRPTVSNHR